MDNQNTFVWVLILLAGLAAGAAFIWLSSDSLSVEPAETAHSDTDHGHDEDEGVATPVAQPHTETEGNSAVILMDAFHWGWVPQVLQAGPGVEAVVGSGAQGSAIHIPLGTRVQLILRNAGGNSKLHQMFEDRFHDYFIEKYGEAWEMIHQAGHGASEEDSHEDEADAHAEGEDAHNDEHDESEAGHDDADPMMQHAFLLEGYNLHTMLPNDPEHNISFIEFTADQPGEFRFMCVNFCGIGHDAMQGVLKVVGPGQN